MASHRLTGLLKEAVARAEKLDGSRIVAMQPLLKEIKGLCTELGLGRWPGAFISIDWSDAPGHVREEVDRTLRLLPRGCESPVSTVWVLCLQGPLACDAPNYLLPQRTFVTFENGSFLQPRMGNENAVDLRGELLGSLGQWIRAAGCRGLLQRGEREAAAAGSAGKMAPRGPLTDLQRELWDLLEGTSLHGCAISRHLYQSPLHQEAVRGLIFRMRHQGWEIEWASGAGYYRPDAPPPELAIESDKLGSSEVEIAVARNAGVTDTSTLV